MAAVVFVVNLRGFTSHTSSISSSKPTPTPTPRTDNVTVSGSIIVHGLTNSKQKSNSRDHGKSTKHRCNMIAIITISLPKIKHKEWRSIGMVEHSMILVYP